ncbi:MAG: GntR family transcriptional regulator [Fusobacteriaceae bacterium]
MQLCTMEKEEHENIKNYIYRVLKSNIMSLFLKPGEKITETELQIFFKTSRSPIREALVKLEKENLIEIFPQRGTRVSLIDLNLVDDSLFMRKILENEVMKLVLDKKDEKKIILKKLEDNYILMKKLLDFELNTDNLLEFFYLDNLFHENIFEYIGRKNVWETLIFIGTHYERFRVLEIVEKASISFTLEQHTRIIKSIKNSDYDIVSSLKTLHIGNFNHSFQHVYNKYPDFFINSLNGIGSNKKS